MTVRIGLAIGRGAIRAVALRAQKIVWLAETPIASPEELEASITTLLGQAPRARWSRPVLHAAIGPHGAQVKRVVGLPEIGDTYALAAIIREAVGTYFLKNGVALLTTGVRPTGAGAAIAAALDAPYVHAVRAACRSRDYRIGLIAPTAVALLAAFPEGPFQWNDGELTIEVARAGQQLESVRTRPGPCANQGGASTSIAPALAELGADACRYADAFGAAVLDANEPLAVQPDAAPLWKDGWRSRNWARPAAILALGAVAIGLSPLATKWIGDRSAARIASLRPGRLQVISASLAQLDRVSAILSQARTFDSSRTSVTRLLGDLARALPRNAALLSFEWSEEGGELTVLTDTPSGVLAAVRGLPDIGSVELANGVTRQTVGGAELQRITVRFSRKQ